MSWPAYAFNYSTHAKICEQAYQQVSVGARASIDALVDQAARSRSSKIKSFPQLCGWPDKIRKQAKHKHTGKWHYLNVSRSAKEVTPSACPKEGCVLSAIDEMYQRLKNSPKSDWEALGFLGHFVGDIHQPMHVSYADDRGGNRTKVYYDGEQTNLHALWDNTIAGTFFINDDLYRTSDSPVVNMPKTALIWANESLKQTRKIYKGYLSGMSLSEGDILDDRRWITARINQAANRLTDVLESAFKASDVPVVE